MVYPFKQTPLKGKTPNNQPNKMISFGKELTTVVKNNNITFSDQYKQTKKACNFSNTLRPEELK